MRTELDLDLRSIQEARDLAARAREAQREFASASQEEVDRICAAMADAAFAAAGRLGSLAHEETGYGVAAHKRIKDEFSSRTVWQSIADTPTVGVIARDDERRTVEIGWPVGVIAALTPSTNPTSTVIYKALIAVKARNAVVFAPHPSARRCSAEAVRVLAEAGERVGMPAGLVACVTEPSLPGTNELLHHWATSMILATGGTGMVRAAHSAGKPAIGVGPGNVPVYVDRSADIARAASDIVNSKAFDSSVICSTEQSVVADRPIAAELRREMEAHGAYWLPDADRLALERVLFRPDGTMVPAAVGKTPQRLAELAGFQVPASARVLVGDLRGVGPDHPLSREKLTTVLGFYVEDGWREGCERCIELLRFGGDGHSLVIHAADEDVIMAFGLEKPAFRIVVNTWGTLGAVGSTTGLAPAMTLAPGGLGGAVVGDNITVRHVLNIKRLAYEVRRPPDEAYSLAPDVVAGRSVPVNGAGARPDEDVVTQIVRRVLSELGR
jgi:acetaldehyde dehydrogenase (acetylating)